MTINRKRRLRFVAALVMAALSPYTLRADNPPAATSCGADGSLNTCCYFPDSWCLGEGSGWVFNYINCPTCDRCE